MPLVMFLGPSSAHQAVKQRNACDAMRASYDQMRGLVGGSMQQCEQLSEEVMRLEGQVRSA